MGFAKIVRWNRSMRFLTNWDKVYVYIYIYIYIFIYLLIGSANRTNCGLCQNSEMRYEILFGLYYNDGFSCDLITIFGNHYGIG